MEGDLKSENNIYDKELPSLLLKTEENDDFIFETDSYALQNNKDYQELLKSLVKLQSQRIYTVKCLEELQHAREAALSDPFAFVQALQNGEINFRPRLKIAQVVDIDMSKYDICSHIEAIRPKTRRSGRENLVTPKLSDDEKKKVASKPCHPGSKTTKQRSTTYNVYWTTEEQRRLEELLIKYPDEPIAAKRYAKIAKELGSRTLMQVQSRVQKYFIALKKEGLPVPGRDPKSSGLRHVPRKRSYVSHACASSKFMKAFDFEDPLSKRKRMEVFEPLEEYETKLINLDMFDEEEYIKSKEKEDPQVKKVVALKKIQKLKLQELKTGDVIHLGIKCSGCLREPLRGVRWHCPTCPPNPGLNLCDRCSKYFFTEKHTKRHTLKPINSLNVKDTLRYLMNR